MPATASELRSFLGLAVYCQIPNLATLAEPLWQLMKDGAKFDWTSVHDDAVKQIKQAFVKDGFGFFNTSWDIELTVDASPVGLAGVLTQTNPITKERRLISCKSKRLTDVERRYSQFEKEVYAGVWACEKFYLYLLGRKFKLFTDNKAFETIIRNPKASIVKSFTAQAKRTLPTTCRGTRMSQAASH